MLSLLIYCVRALTMEIYLLVSQRAEQGDAKTLSFLQYRTRYLVNSFYSPISVILSLLAYAKFISLRTLGSVAGSMWWLQDRQTFFLKGRLIQLSLLCAIAQGLVAEAERVLWAELLWIEDAEGRLPTKLAAI
jgi:hypothetical protein